MNKKPANRHIALDFDGTLAKYNGWKGIGVYGCPVKMMIARVRVWQRQGIPVSIFTARVSDPTEAGHEEIAIRKWLSKYNLPGDMEITAIKHKKFTEFWDDRAVGIRTNMGTLK